MNDERTNPQARPASPRERRRRRDPHRVDDRIGRDSGIGVAEHNSDEDERFGRTTAAIFSEAGNVRMLSHALVPSRVAASSQPHC